MRMGDTAFTMRYWRDAEYELVHADAGQPSFLREQPVVRRVVEIKEVSEVRIVAAMRASALPSSPYFRRDQAMRVAPAQARSRRDRRTCGRRSVKRRPAGRRGAAARQHGRRSSRDQVGNRREPRKDEVGIRQLHPVVREFLASAGC